MSSKYGIFFQKCSTYNERFVQQIYDDADSMNLNFELKTESFSTYGQIWNNLSKHGFPKKDIVNFHASLIQKLSNTE